MKQLLKWTLTATMMLCATSVVWAKKVSEGTHPALAACPSQNFDEFFKVFSNEIEVQKAFTHLAGIKAEDVQFPVVPLEKERTDDKITFTVTQLKKNKTKIRLDKAETDYQLEFSFKKKACWELVRIEDHSG